MALRLCGAPRIFRMSSITAVRSFVLPTSADIMHTDRAWPVTDLEGCGVAGWRARASVVNDASCSRHSTPREYRLLYIYDIVSQRTSEQPCFVLPFV